MNEGGLPLDDFDLVAAKTAKSVDNDETPFSLLDEVRKVFKNGVPLSNAIKTHLDASSNLFTFKELDNLVDGIPKKFLSKAILSVSCMLIYAKGNPSFQIKKEHTSSKSLLNHKNILEIRAAIPEACIAVMKAIAFLSLRCGIHNSNKLHYKLMI